jgi:hypothetical protein
MWAIIYRAALSLASLHFNLGRKFGFLIMMFSYKYIVTYCYFHHIMGLRAMRNEWHLNFRSYGCSV